MCNVIFYQLCMSSKFLENFLRSLLSKVRLGNVDSEIERTLKSRVICSSDLHYSKYALYVFAENVSVFNHNKVMLDQINDMPITIDAIDLTPLVVGFQIVRFWQLEISAFLKQVVFQKLQH